MIKINRTEATQTCGECGETFAFGAKHQCAPLDASTPDKARSVIRSVLGGRLSDRDVEGLARAFRTLGDQSQNENT